MADVIGIEVYGADELRRSIRAAQGNLSNLKALHSQIANQVLPFVLYATPRQSGALLGTIRAGATTKAAIIRAGSKAVPYAGVTHYGWPAAKMPFKSQAPHPWMLDAVHDSERFWSGTYFQGIQKIIDGIGNQ